MLEVLPPPPVVRSFNRWPLGTRQRGATVRGTEALRTGRLHLQLRRARGPAQAPVRGTKGVAPSRRGSPDP